MSQLPAVQSPIPWNKWGILSSVLTPSQPPSWHPIVRPFPGCHDTQGRVLSGAEKLRGHVATHFCWPGWLWTNCSLTLLPRFSDFKMGVLAYSSISPGWCDRIRENGRCEAPTLQQAAGSCASTRPASWEAPDIPQHVKSCAQTQSVKWRGQTTTQG